MASSKRLDKLTLEGVKIVFRNFEGRVEKFNATGKRQFGVLLSPEMAKELQTRGYNVKYLKPRPDDEDDELQAYLKVTVSFKYKRPNIYMVTQTRRGMKRTLLEESMLPMLDTAEITNVDMIIEPSEYEINDMSGITAYASSMFITIQENELEQKYREMEEEYEDDE